MTEQIEETVFASALELDITSEEQRQQEVGTEGRCEDSFDCYLLLTSFLARQLFST
jgi:hypothetical protein